MKKSVKKKGSKDSTKRSAVPEAELPSLVTAMAKLVERLEGVERKMDQVLGRVSNLPSDVRNAVQAFQRPNPAHQTQGPQQHPQQPAHQPDHGSSAHNHGHDGRRERMMHQAVCADCRKNCEVPFKPTEERPVYCKACFAIRKGGRGPQVPDSRGGVASHLMKKAEHVPMPLTARPQEIKKQKPARNSGAKSKKRK